ncbi:MAG: M55 family metallopeptidase [Terriglobia bacterium]|jgi:D-amino peptidase
MTLNLPNYLVRVLVAIAALGLAVSAGAQSRKPLKVLMITDMEGVDGIFDSELQCIPNKSPRWEESRKLLTGEINAAVEGLLEGGATEVVVWDGHASGENLSTLDIHPKATLLSGPGVPGALLVDSSYSAEIFIGQHAMAGAEKGILAHSESSEGIQNYWVNGIRVGEIGLEVMHAGAFGVPDIMLAGDTAACEEIKALVPNAECAEVKSGVSRTGGYSLSHPAACALIREKAALAVRHLSEYKPYRTAVPVELKIEYTTRGTPTEPRPNFERLDDRTWVTRGKDFMEVYGRI